VASVPTNVVSGRVGWSVIVASIDAAVEHIAHLGLVVAEQHDHR
jgi:hypothetical protein